ncbi:MAG: ankyrin repeat domain-containing protein [Coxiellaceae bacterium]|nr:MAG: ankyrin repeat domain-containing protein [Coxiellaceae bacterium]
MPKIVKTDINLTDAADVSALIHAIDIVGDLSLVEFLLQKGASVNHITKSSGYTALLTAVRNGRKDIVEALLKSGALPNQANHDGNTALHIAVMRRNLPLVRFFMQETNADPNRKNLQGETPVHVAFDELHDPTIVDCESVELLQALCQMDNVKINAVNNKGETPLHIASQVGDVESVSYLLTLGADVFIKNEDGKRPIDICEEDEIKVMLQEAMQTSTGSFSFKDQQKVTTFGGNTNNNSATDEPSQLQKCKSIVY